MDRYVVRQPRQPKQESPTKQKKRRLTQATIESLQGVVVVEDIWRLKGVLKIKNQCKENLLGALKQLQRKTPSREVLKSTKIGHTVNNLTKHEDAEVNQLAADILKHWKHHFESKLDKPLIEVKCDAKTEKLRTAGRKHLTAALGGLEKQSLAELIERETFSQHKHLISNTYRRTMRTLIFALKHQQDIQTQLINKTLSIADFVSQYKKETKPS